MYDMYPWDSASQGDYPPSPLRSRRHPAAKAQPAPEAAREAAPAQVTPAQAAPAQVTPAQAVQIALDRRDNGGPARQRGDAADEPTPAPARQ